MGRPRRINVAEGLYHVIQRGNDRQLIFFGDDDRRAFLNRLARCAADCACRVHAYCLMSNHLHLLVQTSRPNLSVFGQQVFGGHALWMNRHHQRIGHLFQGRFTSRLVGEDPYLLQVSRYIHLNPVRARMVERPEEYPWSSMRAYLLGARGPQWVHTTATLAYFGGSRQRYVAFVAEGLREAVEETMLSTDDVQVPGRAPAAIDLAVTLQTDSGSRQKNRPGIGVEELIERTLQEVSAAYGIAPSALQQKYVRQPNILAAKAQAASALQQIGLSLREIGRRLGGMSATAVAHYLRQPAHP